MVRKAPALDPYAWFTERERPVRVSTAREHAPQIRGLDRTRPPKPRPDTFAVGDQ